MIREFYYVLYDKQEPSKEYEHDVKSRENLTPDEADRRNRELADKESHLRWILYSDYERIW